MLRVNLKEEGSMSIWDDEWEDYELDKYDFEVWLDSLNKPGDPKKTDEELYNEWIDEQAEQEQSLKCPEWIIETPKFIYRICLN